MPVSEALPLPAHEPEGRRRHPPVSWIPFANVEVADVPVTFRYVDCVPPVSVVVAALPNVNAPVELLMAAAATDEVALYVEVAR